MSQSENRRMNRIISIRCTAEEKSLIELAAIATRQSVSQFVRGASLRRAEEIAEAIARGGAA